MGLDISLYEIIDFNENLVKDKKTRLFNLDKYSFSGELFDIISTKQFIYAEEQFDFSPIPIGSKILENDWEEIDNKYRAYIKYKTLEGEEKILKDIPTKMFYGYYILSKEIGYQRKGANKEFYLDDIWSSEPIGNLDLLKRHYKRYFSGQKGGKKERLKEKKTTEYLNMTNKELSNRFKENILSKFIEGKTFLLYH
jgi:hypothetical protein